jgi:hypothetical protein
MKTQQLYTAADVETMDIRNIDLTVDAVIWSRGGEKRKISKQMIVDAVRLWMDGVKMVAAGRMPELPSEWSSIYWSSCTPIPTTTTVTISS